MSSPTAGEEEEDDEVDLLIPCLRREELPFDTNVV